MKRGSLITTIAIAGITSLGQIGTRAQQVVGSDGPVATFKASVDLVRVSAVVRDKKGRFVHDLKAHDFEVTDGGIHRTISDFRRDEAGVSVAMLFDASGSMEMTMPQAREAAAHMLSWMNREEDEAAIYTFDTRLDEVTPFTSRLSALPDKLAAVRPFGATSLHDAIARTAEKVASREGLRRAVVVFTDGRDNASHLSPGEVSGIASAIDVPVYIVGVVSPLDDPSAPTAAVSAEHSVFTGSLGDLSAWTGGRTFVVSSIAQRSLVARQIVDELRHQYLIAFESSRTPGWHPLVVRARDKDLTVRARSGYIAGQSRPASQ